MHTKLDSSFPITPKKPSLFNAPPVIFHWQKFPMELRMIELSKSPWEFLCIMVYYWRDGQPRGRVITFRDFAERLPFLKYGKDGVDPLCLEKFFRLAHWHITALAMTDGAISAKPPTSADTGTGSDEANTKK